LNDGPSRLRIELPDSGKHKTTGVNVQVACTLTGSLAWISDPVAGSRHDTHCLQESGVLLALDPGGWLGDKGYVGNRMITPIKKPIHRDLLDWERIQHADQQGPLHHRTDHRQLQNVAHHAHRLPPTARHLRRNHFSGNRSTLLRSRVNKPPLTLHYLGVNQWHSESLSN
jgi:hypothetical protein